MRALLIGLVVALAFGCAECEEDFDCPGTQVCGSSATCEAFVCKRSEDCPPGHVCGENRCVEQEPSRKGPETPDARVFSPPG